MEYDSFAAAGCVMDSFSSSDLLNMANSGSTFIPSNMQRASYAHQRTSLLVKVIANLHCYVPGICKGSAFSDIFSDVGNRFDHNHIEVLLIIKHDICFNPQRRRMSSLTSFLSVYEGSYLNYRLLMLKKQALLAGTYVNICIS